MTLCVILPVSHLVPNPLASGAPPHTELLLVLGGPPYAKLLLAPGVPPHAKLHL